MQEKSRTEYFRKRRETIGQFNISIRKDKLEAFDKVLKEKGQTKTAWLNQKIDEELSEKK